MMFTAIGIIFQIILLFFLSGFVKKKLYTLFFRISKSNTATMAGITALLYPGTVVHELAHLITALILFVPVKKLMLEPERSADGMIRAGSVEIVHVDLFRRTLVGIAPLFVGIATLWAVTIYVLPVPPFVCSNTIQQYTTLAMKQCNNAVKFSTLNFPFSTLLSLYLLFSISASMFSSKKDLEAARIVLPIAMGLLAIAYVLGIPFSPIAEFLSAADSVIRVFVNVLIIPLILHVLVAGLLALVVK